MSKVISPLFKYADGTYYLGTYSLVQCSIITWSKSHVSWWYYGRRWNWIGRRWYYGNNVAYVRYFICKVGRDVYKMYATVVTYTDGRYFYG